MGELLSDYWLGHRDGKAELEAENERLRAALQKIFERKDRTELDARIMWDTAARALSSYRHN